MKLSKILPSCYRLVNYEQYLANARLLEKQSDVCILVLAFNQIDAVKKLCEFFDKNKNKCDFDVLIVDTAHGHSQGVLDRVKWIKKNFPDEGYLPSQSVFNGSSPKFSIIL